MFSTFSRITFILLLFANPALGQFYAEYNSDIPVIRDGETLANAWSGGINTGQISRIDANQNGMEDVFVFDRAGNKVLVFLNNGSDDPNSFEYSYYFSNQFPALRNWVLLRDYNCDGKKDIFSYNGIGGIKLFRNVSTASDGLQFELVTNTVQSFWGYELNPYYSNIYISSVDIPAIDDLDGDGDLDIMAYAVSGSLMEYHQNFSVEENGACDSLFFELRNRCYGYFSESAFDNSITLHDEETHNSFCPPGYNIPDPSPISERPDHIEYQETEAGGPRHAGTTILSIEMNQEFPKEIVLGDIGSYNLTALTNSHTSSGMDSITAAEVAFPENYGNADAVEMRSFPASFYEDMDNDGVRDLLVCPNDPGASENAESISFYRNTGLDNNPYFELVQHDLFQEQMIDVGEGCAPVFFDYNQDGLPDLLVGNKGYFESPGVYRSQIALYENTGSAQNPEFTHVTDDFENIGDIGLGQGLHPAFGDLNNDGVIDMLVGDSSGRIYIFNNTAAAGEPVNFEISDQPVLKDSEGVDIDPGQYATPQLIDLNRDGLIDLVTGERNGRIFYYQNNGTPSAASFELVDDFLGEVETSEGFSTTGFSVIRFIDLDNEYHLFVGTESGKVRWYSNIDDNLSGTFTLETDQLHNVQNGTRSAPAVVDINNDGFVDFFYGNFGGGLVYFQGGTPSSVSNADKSTPEFIMYPNPTNSQLNIVLDHGFGSDPVLLEIISVTGITIRQSLISDSKSLLDLSGLPAGIYIVRLQDRSTSLGSRKLIVR